MSVCGVVSGAQLVLEQGADANLMLLARDAAAIHLAAGVESRSDRYTALLLDYSANPNLPYVYWCFFRIALKLAGAEFQNTMSV